MLSAPESDLETACMSALTAPMPVPTPRRALRSSYEEALARTQDGLEAGWTLDFSQQAAL
jgi:hypothetical protein